MPTTKNVHPSVMLPTCFVSSKSPFLTLNHFVIISNVFCSLLHFDLFLSLRFIPIVDISFDLYAFLHLYSWDAVKLTISIHYTLYVWSRLARCYSSWLCFYWKISSRLLYIIFTSFSWSLILSPLYCVLILDLFIYRISLPLYFSGVAMEHNVPISILYF